MTEYKRKYMHFLPIFCIMTLLLGITGCSMALRGREDTTEDEGNPVVSSEMPENGDKEEKIGTEVAEAAVPAAETEASEEERRKDEAAELIAEMTLEEKVAQLFMITPEELTGYADVTEASSVTRQALEEYPVGGIIFFGNNILSPEQLTRMTTDLKSYSMEITGLPLFLGIDEEGGKVVRIAENDNFDVPRFPDMSEIGASSDLDKAYEAGTQIGAYLHQYGLNLDFAPVADVLTNPEHELLRARSFGEDAELVSKMDLAFMRGIEEQGVMSCMKHFPGHGATSGDTHQGYSYTEKTLEEMKTAELIPFQQGIDAGISFIMVSHIAAPNVTKDQIPATMSGKLITDVLRTQMGYGGIVITDAMNMGAVVNDYDSKTAAINVILAGADLVLMPKDFKSAYQGILDAVNEGTITEERIDQSVQRIFSIKMKI